MILMIGLLFCFPQGNSLQAANAKDQTTFEADNPEIAPAGLSQEEGGVASIGIKESAPAVDESIEQAEGGNFLLDNWGVLLLGLIGFFDLVARLTPTQKDNSIVNFLFSLFSSIIPNLKKGGGSFKLLSK